MTEIKKLICDTCGEDCITYSSYPAKYSFELKAINTNINNTGSRFAVYIGNPLEETVHFCSKLCLVKFIKEKFNE